MADKDKTRLLAHLGDRSIVLVGLMACGKSSVGRRLSVKLGLPFVDADDEIERAAGKSIREIFTDHGEAYFRDGERRVITRLLQSGPQVLATGGGAYMNETTRASIAENGVSVWLHADLELHLRRAARRTNRPLLEAKDPRAVMQELMTARYPFYALANVSVESREVPHDVMVERVIAAMLKWLDQTSLTIRRQGHVAE